VVKSTGSDEEWKFSGLYGHLEVGKGKKAWRLLRYLQKFAPKAWLCVGDFNEVLDASEKFGLHLAPNREEDFDMRQAEHGKKITKMSLKKFGG
jgi:hypothetical protein